MVKKSTAWLITFLILINTTGCYTYSQIEKETKVGLEGNNKVKIITLDGKEYTLTKVEIQGSIVKGREYENRSPGNRKDTDIKRVTRSTEQIKKIMDEDPFLSRLMVSRVYFLPNIGIREPILEGRGYENMAPGFHIDIDIKEVKIPTEKIKEIMLLPEKF